MPFVKLGSFNPIYLPKHALLWCICLYLSRTPTVQRHIWYTFFLETDYDANYLVTSSTGLLTETADLFEHIVQPGRNKIPSYAVLCLVICLNTLYRALGLCRSHCCASVSAGHYGKRLLICVLVYRRTKPAARCAQIGYVSIIFYKQRICSF